MAQHLLTVAVMIATIVLTNAWGHGYGSTWDVVDWDMGRTHFPESKALNESSDAELKIVLKKPNDLWTCCLDDDDFCMKHKGVQGSVVVEGKAESRWTYPFVVETTRQSCGKQFSYKVENRTERFNATNSTTIFVQFKPNRPVIKRAQYDLRTNCLVITVKPEDTGKCQLRYSVTYNYDWGKSTSGEFNGTKTELDDLEIRSCWKEQMYNDDARPNITVEASVRWNTMRNEYERNDFEESGEQVRVPVTTFESNTTCPGALEMVFTTTGRCEYPLTKEECMNGPYPNENFEWSGVYNRSSLPTGCLIPYPGATDVIFNEFNGTNWNNWNNWNNATNCSSERPCLCKKGKGLSGGPPMKRFANIKDEGNYTKLKGTPAEAYIKTLAYSNVNGKDMQGGVLKLVRGDPLVFTHWYEGLAFVLDGHFQMSYKNESAPGDRSTVIVNAGQSLHIPRGMEITYETSYETSYLYFAILTPTMEQQALNRSQKELKLTIKRDAMEIYPNISWFNNTQNSRSYLVDMLVAGYGQRDNLVGGLYKLLKGPALDYTYEYEEFKYIVSGEFILTDGTGQKVSAKAGDLMYFPIGCAVHFTSPDYALGFYVGQRKWGTA